MNNKVYTIYYLKEGEWCELCELYEDNDDDDDGRERESQWGWDRMKYKDK